MAQGTVFHRMLNQKQTNKQICKTFIKQSGSPYNNIVSVFPGTACLGPRGELVSFKRVGSECGNVTSRAMPGTFHVLPWAGCGKYKVGEVLCENEWSPTEKMGMSTRSLARKLIDRLKSWVRRDHQEWLGVRVHRPKQRQPEATVWRAELYFTLTDQWARRVLPRFGRPAQQGWCWGGSSEQRVCPRSVWAVHQPNH